MGLNKKAKKKKNLKKIPESQRIKTPSLTDDFHLGNS